MMRVGIGAARILGFSLLLLLGIGGLAWACLKSTVPASTGTLAIPGLSAHVEVIRDNEGVPHIFASTVDDGLCALGFVHAQDRLWQMELALRAGQGRLSEIFGPSTFDRDVLLRTLDLYGHAERSLSAISPVMRNTLEAYARGVNAFIERHTRLFEARLPPAAARRAGRQDALLEALERWDATMDPDRVEPLVFTAWERETIRAIYQRPLGPAFSRFFDPRALALIRLLQGRAASRNWCPSAVSQESAQNPCDNIISQAFTSALEDLQKRYGADPALWRWGKAHIALSEHRPFGLIPGLGYLFNVEVPIPGGTYTLNRGIVAFREEPIFVSREATSYRAIYDLSDLDRSLYIQSTGQSGNAVSPFYRSFSERWQRVDYIAIPIRRSEITNKKIGVWTLTRVGQ